MWYVMLNLVNSVDFLFQEPHFQQEKNELIVRVLLIHVLLILDLLICVLLVCFLPGTANENAANVGSNKGSDQQQNTK